MPREMLVVKIHKSYIDWINERRKYQPETGEAESSQAYIIEQCIFELAKDQLPPGDTPGKVLGKKRTDDNE